MPATRKATARKPVTRKRTTAAAKKSRSKRPSRATPASSRALGKRTHTNQVKERLHGAIRRTAPTVSEKEFEETTAAVLAIVAELAAETAAVFGEVLARIEMIERRLNR